MKALIPPPVVLLICGALMWVIDRFFPAFDFLLRYNTVFFWMILLSGLSLLATAAVNFFKRKTTIHPDRKSLSEATSLLKGGVYRYTRNPIYLGMAIMLVAWLIFLQNVLSAFGVIIFVLFITRYQIRPEEKALEKIFGEEYVRYKKAVRRWI